MQGSPNYDPGPVGYWTQAWHTASNALVYAATRGRKLQLEGRRTSRQWHNWTFGERQHASIVVPTSEAEIVDAIVDSEQLRVVGSGHSFNDAIRSATLMSLDDYSGVIEGFDHPTEHCNEEGVTYVRARAGTRVRDLSRLLAEKDLAIEALPSHDSQSIAGVLSTDVHGTGRELGFVSSSVVGLRLVDGTGTGHDVWRGDDLFAAAIGGVGAVGVITEVSVRCVPAFNLEQATSWVALDDARTNWRDWLTAHQHMSFYVFPYADQLQLHTWNPTTDPVTKRAAVREYLHIAWAALAAAWFGDASAKFGQLRRTARVGPKLQRPSTLVLPSAAGFNRSIYPMHQELEFAAPLDQAWELIDLMNAIYEDLAKQQRLPFMLIEVRFTPANGTYGMISPASGEQPRVWLCLVAVQSPGWREYFDAVEAELLRRGDDARPHLGKYCAAYSAAHMQALHGDSFQRFIELRRAHDPHGRFANNFTRRIFGTEEAHP